MTKADWPLVALCDSSAGLVVAMMAIPMAMGFAIASGLRPEHGILAGAVAALIGALFGGSRYNVFYRSFKSPETSLAETPAKTGNEAVPSL